MVLQILDKIAVVTLGICRTDTISGLNERACKGFQLPSGLGGSHCNLGIAEPAMKMRKTMVTHQFHHVLIKLYVNSSTIASLNPCCHGSLAIFNMIRVWFNSSNLSTVNGNGFFNNGLGHVIKVGCPNTALCS